MAGYIGRRALYTILVMIVASIVVFYALRVAPGDPTGATLSPLARQEAREAVRERLGLNLPIYQQYFVFMKHVFQGDLGRSLISGKGLDSLIIEFGARTLVLGLTALVLSYLIALPLGVLAALKRNSICDQLSMFLANLGMGIPSFWLALLLILAFSVHLRLLPISGSGDLKHLILPAIVLSAEGTAVTMRLMRSSMLEQLSQDYIRTLYAKGLVKRRIIWVHAFRNALVPIISLSGLRLGWLLGYTLIVETVFRWPGLGFLLVDSVIRRDYPVAQMLSLLLALSVLLANFLANLGYAAVDPRIRRA
jgi:peptide/nickel transport system permease protein